MREALFVAAAMLGFGVVHSLTAGVGLKPMLKQLLGERIVAGGYRLFYNILSVVTLLPALVLVALLPAETLYSANLPVAIAMRLVQLAGLIGLAVSVLAIDLGRFLGLSQAMAFLTGGDLPLPPEKLVQTGVYSLTRHPLYLFSLMFIWLNPTMTTTLLAFNLCATLYFVVGSLIEERRMVRYYGKAYKAYQQQVPWLIPLPSVKD